LKILKAWYERSQGYPLLRLKLEGIEPVAIVDLEANKHLKQRQWDAVFLGPMLVGRVPPVMRDGIQRAGFSDDAEIVKLAKQFLEDTASGEFKPGRVLVEEQQ
jgi:hypothetical protein